MTKNYLTTILLCFIAMAAWALDAPNPTSPSNGVTNAYTRQQFYWALVSGAGAYELQVDTTTAFNSPLLIERTFTDNSKQMVYQFRYNTHYYWRMRSVSKTDNSIKSDWCALREFTTLSQVTLVSPNNPEGTSNFYPKQDFTWKNSYGSTKYIIEIDTTNRFNSPALVRENYTCSQSNSDEKLYQTVSNLYMKCTTYWRVKAFNDNDSSEWSETARFNMISRAVAQSPKDLQNAKTTQSFEWKYQKGLNSVIIELDSTDRFDSPFKQTFKTFGSSQSDCYYSVSKLMFGQDYYWRVKGYHSKDTTEWSEPLYFHTFNHCNLSTPADSATNQYTLISLYWKYFSDIGYYQIQLDTTPQFNSPMLQSKVEYASSSDNAYMSYSELFFGQNYYWRVRCCHSNDTSRWSETRMFTTYRHCNLNKDPQDNATDVITSPKVEFNYTKGISYYQMQLDTTPDFNSPLLQDHVEYASKQSNAYYYYVKLLFGTTYYRRVRECLPNDTSDWSPIRCFTTYDSGAYSTTYSIAKGATGQSVTPKLYYAYRSYIDSVEIQIDTTINFDSPLLESIRAKEASSQTYAYEQLKQTLLYGTTYYWRIRDIHTNDISGWTTPRYFTTEYKLSQPTLVGPVNQSVMSDTETVDLSWNKCEDAVSYIVQVARDGQFTDILYQSTTSDCTTSIASLPADMVLYWRICAVNEQGRSSWSSIWSLSISSPIGTNLFNRFTDLQTHKLIIDNQLHIFRNGKMYNAMGGVMR
ncbi:MAG: hypothetical protein MJZ65_04850 [Paludibacteraceae bacterium]|nr:hypothetical protein [Paludibacteraceae bacterium]